MKHLIKYDCNLGPVVWCDAWVADPDDGKYSLDRTDCLECLYAIDKFSTEAFFRRLDLMNERDEDAANHRGK